MSAKLCGVEQRRHLYSAGRLSRSALAHILVIFIFIIIMNMPTYINHGSTQRITEWTEKHHQFLLLLPCDTCKTMTNSTYRMPALQILLVNWRSSYTELCTALHLSTYRASFSTSLICCRDVEAGCARRPPVSLTSVRCDLLLSAIVRLLLPARDSGTVYLSTSSLPRHSQHFVRN